MTTKKPRTGFTKEELDAMRTRVRELRTKGADGESEVLAKLAAMSKPDRAIGTKLHAIIRATAPSLVPRLWYGMPAYTRDGKVVCFFQRAEKFKTRYATLGFQHDATLDDGVMWPTSYAILDLTAAEETRITALVKRAVRE